MRFKAIPTIVHPKFYSFTKVGGILLSSGSFSYDCRCLHSWKREKPNRSVLQHTIIYQLLAGFCKSKDRLKRSKVLVLYWNKRSMQIHSVWRRFVVRLLYVWFMRTIILYTITSMTPICTIYRIINVHHALHKRGIRPTKQRRVLRLMLLC
jgi:hypothetical protein